MYTVSLCQPETLPYKYGIQSAHDGIKIPDAAIMFLSQIHDHISCPGSITIDILPVKITIIRYRQQDGCQRKE